MYSTVDSAVKMVVANKVDKVCCTGCCVFASTQLCVAASCAG